MNPVQDMEELTVNKVVGAPPSEAWDILPFSIEEVAQKTGEDKVYGKLLRSVEAGTFDRSDKDLTKFSGVFDNLTIENGVLFFWQPCSNSNLPTC